MTGGYIVPGYVPGREGDDTIRVFLSPGEEITDADRAEQLGLTVEARRLRAAEAAEEAP